MTGYDFKNHHLILLDQNKGIYSSKILFLHKEKKSVIEKID